jgi:[acyl-carrier-protein] S-malonyltransferase
LLKEKGVQCQAVAGYGIGQLTALHVAGSLTLPDGLYFLSKYAQFYQEELEKTDGALICISGIPVDKVKKWCEEFHHISIAAYHSLTECVVSGLRSEIVGIKDLALKMDARVTEVPVQSGMHSKLMASVEQQMRVYLEKIDFHDFNCPLISSVDGSELTSGAIVREHTMKQLVAPIHWDKVMDAVADWQLVVQCGPGSSLKNLIELFYPEKKFIAINNPDDIDTLLKQIHE